MLDGWEIKSKRPDGDGTDMMEKEGQYMCKRVELPGVRPRPKTRHMKDLQIRFKLANSWIRIQTLLYSSMMGRGSPPAAVRWQLIAISAGTYAAPSNSIWGSLRPERWRHVAKSPGKISLGRT